MKFTRKGLPFHQMSVTYIGWSMWIYVWHVRTIIYVDVWHVYIVWSIVDVWHMYIDWSMWIDVWQVHRSMSDRYIVWYMWMSGTYIEWSNGMWIDVWHVHSLIHADVWHVYIVWSMWKADIAWATKNPFATNYCSMSYYMARRVAL